MKIVLVGGGSYVFAPTVLHDFIVKHQLSESELVLVDLNMESVLEMQGLGERMASDEGALGTAITVTSDIDEALPGADFVIASASVQGFRRWEMDFNILRRYGMPDQARECGGLGGMIYTFRSVALMLDICRKMEAICPAAVLLDVTNPMPRIVTAIHRYSSIPIIGFCNMAWRGATGYQWFADLLNRDVSTLHIVTAGLNHFAWLVSIRDMNTNEDLIQAVEHKIRQGTGREFEVMQRWLSEYGGIIAGHIDHHGEYLPYQSGVHYHTSPPFHGNEQERRDRLQQLMDIRDGKRAWQDVLSKPSWEHPVDLAVAIQRRVDTRFDILNVPNEGYIPQLPDGRIVEVPAVVRDGRLIGEHGIRLPDGVAELCRTISDVHELVAEAAVLGDIGLAEEAVQLDPAIGYKDVARRALVELLNVHADVLPQFRTKSYFRPV